MKRAILAAILVCGSALAAHADHDVYNDVTKQNRGDYQLNEDTTYCDAQLGAPQNGHATSAAYKRCMRGRGWAFEHTDLQSGNMVCHATVVSYEEMPFSLNHHNVARMTLRIRPPRGAAYQATVTKSVSRHSPPQRGSTMTILCDPSNPDDIHPAS